MKKSEIAKQYELSSVKFLLIAACLLLLNVFLNELQRFINVDSLMGLLAFVAIVCAIAAFVFTLKGFSAVNKNCKLSENNNDYYMGRNLMIFTIVVFALGMIFSLCAYILNFMIYQYEGQQLTSADTQARANLVVISTVVSLLVHIFSSSTPFVLYLWKQYKSASKGDKTAVIALLSVVLFAVYIVIASLNSVYIAQSNQSEFLTLFSRVLFVAKQAPVVVYFAVRLKTHSAVGEE